MGPAGAHYQAGPLNAFVASLATIGSAYVPPPARPALLDLPAGATATAGSSGSAPLLAKTFTLTTRNKFGVNTPAADKLALSAAPGNGLLAGRFIHPSSGKVVKIQGVLFQKTNFASGFFLHAGESGSFSLEANP